MRPFASRALGVSCARGRGRVCFCDGARSSGGRAGPQAQRAGPRRVRSCQRCQGGRAAYKARSVQRRTRIYWCSGPCSALRFICRLRRGPRGWTVTVRVLPRAGAAVAATRVARPSAR